jgi:hypothetical protein
MSEAKDTGKSRQIMWGGLARVAPNVVGNGHINHRSKVHRFPTEELSKIIHDEFLAHKCEEFARRNSKDKGGNDPF